MDSVTASAEEILEAKVILEISAEALVPVSEEAQPARMEVDNLAAGTMVLVPQVWEVVVWEAMEVAVVIWEVVVWEATV
jgi:hypothetical protein